jgi:hypothetical protein
MWSVLCQAAQTHLSLEQSRPRLGGTVLLTSGTPSSMGSGSEYPVIDFSRTTSPRQRPAGKGKEASSGNETTRELCTRVHKADLILALLHIGSPEG